MNINIKIEYDQLETIVVAALKDLKQDFEEHLERYEDKDAWVAVFETDREKDIKLLKKHVKACNRLLEWYGG